MLSAASRFLSITGVLALTGLACFFGYRFVKADLTAQVYRERLTAIAQGFKAPARRIRTLSAARP